MSHEESLGRLIVKAGEILTFTYRDSTPHPRHVTVVALVDLDLSRHMAEFCEKTNRDSRDIYTEQALPSFIEYLTELHLLHVGKEIQVDIGQIGRPASRLMNEYRFRLNPEAFWEAKLLHRYQRSSFTVFNHQNHLLTVMAGVDAPFTVVASLIDMAGDALGVLRLSVLTDHKYTLLDDEDLERIRLALQADISLSVEEISVLVDSITLIPNPDFGSNPFARHTPSIQPFTPDFQFTPIEEPVK